MKKALIPFLLLILLLAVSCAALSSCQSEGNSVTLYVYNWGEYISDGSEDSLDVNAAFEDYCRETLGMNVTVNYSTFSSNEDMYAKISSGSASYDVIIPSDYMIQRMVAEDLLAPLDLSKIPNYADIAPEFKGENVYYEDDDPATTYSVPYFYGMIGIIHNTSIVSEEDTEIGSWALMWDEEYRGDILQFNNSRDAFGTALYYLGYDVNEATDAEWREALELLKEQKAVVQGYVMDEIFNKMKSGSAAIAAYYAGDYLTMYEDNNDLSFFYPQEGTNFYIDAMCIPKNSKKFDLASEYINFMCSEEVAVANAEYTYYASPLTTVIENADYQEYMAEVHPDAMEILYGEKASSVPTQAYLNLTPDRLSMLNGLWEELKVESSIGAGIYVGCGVILAALTVLVVYQVLKKRRWAKLYD
ncbi:MAG: spermidine/putrescine ABC transporter substrate-binding protein [Ruminococcaceae bacterium]|nr:spermidine/putrescine ABC transporter substrate-binding protein [Oscillospiraceae bacterium]